jgi:uncharacterized membrane protein
MCFGFGFWWIFPLMFFVLMIVCMALCMRRCVSGGGCCCRPRSDGEHKPS